MLSQNTMQNLHEILPRIPKTINKQSYFSKKGELNPRNFKKCLNFFLRWFIIYMQRRKKMRKVSLNRESAVGASRRTACDFRFLSVRRGAEGRSPYRAFERPHSCGNLGGNTERFRPIFRAECFFVFFGIIFLRRYKDDRHQVFT